MKKKAKKEQTLQEKKEEFIRKLDVSELTEEDFKFLSRKAREILAKRLKR